jgi:hypothetical protein
MDNPVLILYNGRVAEFTEGWVFQIDQLLHILPSYEPAIANLFYLR